MVLVCAAIVVTVGVLLLGGGEEEQGPPSSYDVELDEEYAAYCEEVEEQQAALGEALAAGPTTGLIDALPSFRALAEKSPDDLEDEWSVVVGRIEGLVAALEGAGVDPASYDRKDPAADLDPDDRAAVRTAAVRAALQALHARVSGSPGERPGG